MTTHSTWVHMSHDGFARETLARRTVETDGINARRFTLEGLFCGNTCRKAYHGLG